MNTYATSNDEFKRGRSNQTMHHSPHLREDLRRDEREEDRAVDGLVEAEREVGGDAELRRVDRGDADELGRLDAKGDGEGVEAHRAVACAVGGWGGWGRWVRIDGNEEGLE